MTVAGQPVVLLMDRSIERITNVAKACFRSAMLAEIRTDNPVTGAVLPKRDGLAMPGDDDEKAVKALTRAELATFLSIVHPKWRTFFRLLAATGLRISEILALDVRHLQLDGSQPHVKVRRAWGRYGMDRPKSTHGVREIPLPSASR